MPALLPVVSSNKKRLIIISAGAFGREIRDIADGIELALGEDCPWTFAGFLDDRPDILKSTNSSGVRIFCSPAEYTPQANDLFISAIGSPCARRRYAEMIRSKGGKFATLVEPRSLLGRVAKLEEGVLIGPFCSISCDLSIGTDTMIVTHATIGHDVRIGRACHIGAYSFVGGEVVIGDEVTIHPHAVILPKISIGDRAVIGTGSIVTANVAGDTTVFGSPARRVAT